MSDQGARRGRFVTVEGGEGAGKSTQVRALAQRLAQAGVDCLVTREPGGTPVANAIRALLVSKTAVKSAPMFRDLFETLGGIAAAADDAEALDAFKAIFTALGAPIDARAEALLHYAARADHWRQAISPMLANGRWVVCDRFADSTLAYQGAAGGVGQDFIVKLHNLVLPDVWPDLTIILDISPEAGLGRARASRTETSRYEDKDLAYHQKVRQAFLELAKREPQRCVRLDAHANPEAVAERVWAAVGARFGLKPAER